MLGLKRLNIRVLVIFAVMLVMVISFTFTISAKANRNTGFGAKEKCYKSVYIEKGETLWHLAETYMDEDYYSCKLEYISDIKKLNNLKSDTIKQGNYILVYYYK